MESNMRPSPPPERNKGIPTRQVALESIRQSLLPQLAELYSVEPDDIRLLPDYHEGQNLVFFYERTAVEYVLRVSFRDDRVPDQILAELDFVNYLYEHGVRVSRPIVSREGRFMEILQSDDHRFAVVSFERARGHRLPDRGYQYREGVLIDEYFHNWGRLLGQMHRLAQQYTPNSPARTRPELLDVLANHSIPTYLPPSFDKVRERFEALHATVSMLPKSSDVYGLIHADFSDGNFCVDYANGDITAFDFDDAAYCWFMYDLADAWRCGVGWTATEKDPGKRREFMDQYFDTLLSGYAHEHSLPDAWLNRLPLFLKLIEMEAVLSEFREIAVNGADEEYDGALAYQLKCIEEDVPYLGFFDSIYSHDHPFELPPGA
jgi:Ser/Thr protein kinase RdoA (MazF antagonist)